MASLNEEPISTEPSPDAVELTETGRALHPVAAALARMTREDRERMELMLAEQEIRRERMAA